MGQRPILAVSVNPALDICVHVPRLMPQRKLRCSEPRIDPGGGGVNVSRVVKELGGVSTAFLAVGGATGTQLATLLADAGIKTEIFQVGGETRSSFTAMEDETGEHYRFVLPGPRQHTDSGPMREAIRVLMPPSGLVVITGSLLPGLPEDFYRQLVLDARACGATVIVDAHGVELQSAVTARPDIVRTNHIEAEELLGRAPTSLPAMCKALLDRGVAETVLVSRGADGTVLASSDGAYWIRPPGVDVQSSVGAGDSFLGALALELARGRSMVEAARLGVAAAASAVLAEGTGLCRRDVTEALWAQTSVETLDLMAAS